MNSPKKNLLRDEFQEIKHKITQECRNLSVQSIEKMKEKKIRRDMDTKDLLEDQWEDWSKKHGKPLNKTFLMNDIREIREWFHALDRNGSGGISIDELIDPLMSSGILTTKSAIQGLINLADLDGSGEINVDEFLHVIQKGLLSKKSLKKLKEITRKSDDGLSTSMSLSQERRARMMDCVVNKALKRIREIDELYCQEQDNQQPLSPHRISNCHQIHQRRKGHVYLATIDPSQLATEHYHQQKQSNLYLQSLNKIIIDNREQISNDNVTDSNLHKSMKDKSLSSEQLDIEYENLVDDILLDSAYEGGKSGRIASLKRLDKVLPSIEYQNRFQFTRAMTLTNYSKYDSRQLYSTYEVEESANSEDTLMDTSDKLDLSLHSISEDSQTGTSSLEISIPSPSPSPSKKIQPKLKISRSYSTNSLLPEVSGNTVSSPPAPILRCKSNILQPHSPIIVSYSSSNVLNSLTPSNKICLSPITALTGDGYHKNSTSLPSRKDYKIIREQRHKTFLTQQQKSKISF